MKTKSSVQAGIGAALDEFHGKQQGEQQLPPLTGLLFTMAYRGRVRPDLLIGNRVRDAVRHDGNSSTLLGYDSTMVFGVPMIVAKRNGQRWGFQCQAE